MTAILRMDLPLLLPAVPDALVDRLETLFVRGLSTGHAHKGSTLVIANALRLLAYRRGFE